jgi:hypothetical protein
MILELEPEANTGLTAVLREALPKWESDAKAENGGQSPAEMQSDTGGPTAAAASGDWPGRQGSGYSGCMTCEMENSLRQTLLDALLRQGFTLADGQLVPPDPLCKDNIRQLYVHLRLERLQEAYSWLLSIEERVLPCFANGPEVDVERLHPRLELVDTQRKADVFRYA